MSRTVLVGCLLLASTSALAQPSLTPSFSEPPVPEEVTTTYASQTLTVDALAMGLLLAGAIAEGPGGHDTNASTALMQGGLIGLSFGAPLVHASHGHWGRAAGSLGLRWGLSLVGIMVAAGLNSCDEHEQPFCKLDSIGSGVIAGMAVASLVDAATMTQETRTGRVWSPTLGAHHGGVQLGLAAEF